MKEQPMYLIIRTRDYDGQRDYHVFDEEAAAVAFIGQWRGSRYYTLNSFKEIVL